MKILHVIPSIAAVRGGPSQAVLQMVKHLRQQQVQAEIITTNDNGPGTLSVPLDRWTLADGVPVRYFNRYSPRLGKGRMDGAAAGLREFNISIGMTHWLWQHLEEYDLVHIHALFSYPCLAAMAIARARGIPYWLRPLGSLCQWSLGQSPRKKQAYLQLSRSLLNHSAALHFTSEAEAKEAALLKLAPRSLVLPLGLDMPTQHANPRESLIQQLGCPAEHPLLLFLSRLHPKKGLEILLQALADLPHRNFTLAIAGSGDPAYKQQLQDLVVQRSLQAQVHWLGFVQGEAKQRLLQGADCFVLPSHSENFGIVVLEALAAGLPVMTTPGVALEQVLLRQQLGWVIPPQVSLWRDHLQRLLPQLCPQENTSPTWRDRGRQMVATEFSWPRISQHLIQYYGQSIAETAKLSRSISAANSSNSPSADASSQFSTLSPSSQSKCLTKLPL